VLRRDGFAATRDSRSALITLRAFLDAFLNAFLLFSFFSCKFLLHAGELTRVTRPFKDARRRRSTALPAFPRRVRPGNR